MNPDFDASGSRRRIWQWFRCNTSLQHSGLQLRLLVLSLVRASSAILCMSFRICHKCLTLRKHLQFSVENRSKTVVISRALDTFIHNNQPLPAPLHSTADDCDFCSKFYASTSATSSGCRPLPDYDFSAVLLASWWIFLPSWHSTSHYSSSFLLLSCASLWFFCMSSASCGN